MVRCRRRVSPTWGGVRAPPNGGSTPSIESGAGGNLVSSHGSDWLLRSWIGSSYLTVRLAQDKETAPRGGRWAQATHLSGVRT